MTSRKLPHAAARERRLLLRWRRASRHRRRSVAPVIVCTLAAIVFGVAGWVSAAAGVPDGHAFRLAADLGLYLAVALWPVGYLVGLARARMQRSAVADLAIALSEPLAPGRAQQELARALRDPTLQLVHWMPEHRGYVDVTGDRVSLPGPGSGRAVTVLRSEGAPVAALVHDPALDDDPGLVPAVAATMRLAIENERLHARVRAQLWEVHASRARIVEAMDTGRRRIERNLYDGAQQRLVNLVLALRLAATRMDGGSHARTTIEQAVEELEAALEELRELARGIHPAILTNAGVGPALESLAERAPLPVVISGVPGRRFTPPVEETVYYVASEAVANTAKHARAVAGRHRDGGTRRPAPPVRGRRRRRRRPRRRPRTARPGGPGRGRRRPVPRREPAGRRDPPGGEPAVRLVLADDSLLFREGLARLLTEAGFVVTGQAADAGRLLDLVRAARPDVAVRADALERGVASRSGRVRGGCVEVPSAVRAP
ncbi:histidine kinase [Actinomadura sp. KC345]|uniref:helix-turn-helix transcriptional regulator n=1 Tax=Actinomadura sp. KC345 TaxID=2530371 RepID=UPI001404CCCA|nr:histidine kinase [Actinomadura sp. KC345]